MKLNFFEIGKRLLAESEVAKLLTVAIDFAIEISGAKQNCLSRSTARRCQKACWNPSCLATFAAHSLAPSKTRPAGLKPLMAALFFWTKFERDYIIDCLKADKGNISQAARTTGIDLKNFYDKIKKYGIDPGAFK